jgi:membrane protein required for colicin V production
MTDWHFHPNLVDLIIVCFVALSIVISLMRGFIREALSLTTLVLAIYVAFTFSTTLAETLSGIISSASTRTVVAFIGLFLVVFISGAVVNILISRLVSVSGFGLIDRILGVFFGAARGIIVLGLIIMLIKGTSLTERGWWRHSELIPLFTPLTTALENLFPKESKTTNAPMLHEKKQ